MSELLTVLPNFNLLLITIVIIVIGGILRGFLGFGPALITIPVLAYLYTPTEALVIHIIMEIPSTILLLPIAFRHSQLKQMLPMFTSMILAIPIGMLLIVTIDPQFMRMIISIIVLLLVFFLASGIELKSITGRLSMIISGVIGGFIQGVAGMGGPPIVSVLLARGDDPDTSRGNVMFLMLGIVVFSIATQIFYGLMSYKLIALGLTASPIYMFATYFGSKYYSSKGKKVFRTLSLVLLAIIALSTFVASLI